MSDSYTSPTAEQALAQLEVVRHELMERSQYEGTLTPLGHLADGTNPELWNQGEKAISFNRRRESGEITQDELVEVPERLSRSFVPVAEGAAKRCVDGSTIEGYEDNDPNWYGRALGPQVQGGTADEAFAYRLFRNTDQPREKSTLLGDIREVAHNVKSRFGRGGHIDDHATDLNCGCGAIGGLKAKLEMYGDDESATVAREKADAMFALAGLTPKTGAFEALRESARSIAKDPGYLPGRSMDVIDELRRLNPTGIEKLIRPHGEITLTVNFVGNTTFHRDNYNAQTERKLQNFNLDAWVLIEEYGEEVGYALVVDAIQTLMNLTDGSLFVFARMPAQEKEQTPRKASLTLAA